MRMDEYSEITAAIQNEKDLTKSIFSNNSSNKSDNSTPD